MIKGIIFDFDGLIIDSELPDYQSWKEVYDRYGCELPLSVWKKCIGTSSESFNPYGYLRRQTSAVVDREEIRNARRKRFIEMVNEKCILPGVLDYLECAKTFGLKLGLASSSSREWVCGHLERLGILDRFDLIMTRDDVTRVKPDPALYVKVLEGFGIEPYEAIALEDSLNGMLAAVNAGIFCAVIPNTMTCDLDFSKAGIRLESLECMKLKDLIDTAEEYYKNPGRDSFEGKYE